MITQFLLKHSNSAFSVMTYNKPSSMKFSCVNQTFLSLSTALTIDMSTLTTIGQLQVERGSCDIYAMRLAIAPCVILLHQLFKEHGVCVCVCM